MPLRPDWRERLKQNEYERRVAAAMMLIPFFLGLLIGFMIGRH